MSEYCKDTLANGLRVITVEMPHLHSAEMVFYVGAGGRHEAAETAGISHFLEHMLFRGSEEYPTSLELERAFEAIGGAANASTDAETSCFHSRLHPDHLRQGAALFASMLRRPLLCDLETERNIILEEALEDLNEQGEEISPDNLTARLLWPGTPLALPTIGSRDSIRRIDEATLRRYHAARYTPGNTTMVVTGKVRHADVLAAVRAELGGWQGPLLPPCPAVPALETDDAPQSVWVRESDSQVAVQLAFRVPGRHSPHAVPLRILCRLLSWGASSRLMLRLREQLGLTYHVEANLSLYEDCGCLAVDLSVHPVNLVAAVRELLAVFRKLCQEPVGGEELARLVRGYLYDLDFSLDHTDEMAVRYGWGELVGHLRTLEEDRRDITAATPQALFATARDLFVPAALKGAVVGPFRDQDRPAIEGLLEAFRRS